MHFQLVLLKYIYVFLIVVLVIAYYYKIRSEIWFSAQKNWVFVLNSFIWMNWKHFHSEGNKNNKQ